MFGKDDDTLWTLIGAATLAALLFGVGLRLIKRGKENNKNKKGK